MDTIDVSGLPEPIAQQFLTMVRVLPEQLSEEKSGAECAKLPVWQGSVKDSLRRKQIYANTD